MQTDEISELFVRHRASGILVDANLLLVYVIGCTDEEWVAKFERTRGYSIEDFRLLRDFIACFNRVLTTPNVVTEVNNLASRLSADRAHRFMRVFSEQIGVLDERFVPSAEASRQQYFGECGVTDSAIMIASGHDVLVLTDDFRLYGILIDMGHACVNFNHIRHWAT